MSIKEPFVHTLWCDDIRVELGNKPSFMGVFTGGLLLPSLPVVLPKLCMQTWVCSPLAHPINSVTVEIVRDDGMVVASVSAENRGSPADVMEDSTRRNLIVTMMVGPLEIPADCKWLMARATFADGAIDGPKLRITVDRAAFGQLMGIPDQGAPVEDIEAD